MPKVRISFLILFYVAATVGAAASTLTVSPKHDVVVIQNNEKRQQLRVMFAEDPLLVTVTLNVYVLEQLPSSKTRFDELQQLTESSWLRAVSLTLMTGDGRSVPLPQPALAGSTVRRRGPNAARQVDRDTNVPMTTYRAELSLGSLAPGDYVLKGTVLGLTSTFPFAVRTGAEPELRDHYLRLKAQRTAEYATYRKLQLERLDRDPARLDALYDLIDRALVNGTLAETTSYFDRAIAAADAGLRKTTSDPAAHARMESGIAGLREVKSSLPEVFAKRKSWTMTRDVRTGNYIIRDRLTGAVVRDFGKDRDNSVR